MVFKKITQNTCTCGAHTVRDECRMRHVNGEGFERRTFACGAEIAWSPNFNRLEIVEPCPKSSEVQTRERNLSKVESRIFRAIEGAAVPVECKRTWHNLVRWQRASYQDHVFAEERQKRARKTGVLS